MTAIEPLTFTTLDEVEREFRLTMREQRRIAERHGSNLTGASPVVAFLPAFLYECLVDKGELTLEQFEEVLPADIELVGGFFNALQQHFNPPRGANERYRPPKAAILPSNGSGS
jgi:hypothetical protein